MPGREVGFPEVGARCVHIDRSAVCHTTMKHLASQFRHWVTSLAAIGTYLVSIGLLEPSQVEAANQAGQQMVDPLVALFDPVAALLALVGACVARLALAGLGKLFPSLTQRLGDNASGGMSGGASLLIICTMAAACLLPSCGPLSELPITGSVFFRDPNTGAKSGLTFGITKAARVPLYDSSGQQIGETDLTGPLSREVRAEK